MKMVLQKFISQSGYCSRRQAEALIKKGSVFVNGKKAELGMRADQNDEVKVKGKIIGLAEKKIYIKVNKPIGYTCTNRRFEDEKNIFELLGADNKKDAARLFAAGRLDKASRGLVLLTNDGELTQKLTHPSFGHEKEYLVKVKTFKGHKQENIIERLKKGINIGDGDGIAKAKYVEFLGNNKFKIVLDQGKKRQLRRMFEKMDIEVVDLLRVRIGGLEIGGLKQGAWQYLDAEELDRLLRESKNLIF